MKNANDVGVSFSAKYVEKEGNHEWILNPSFFNVSYLMIK